MWTRVVPVECRVSRPKCAVIRLEQRRTLDFAKEWANNAKEFIIMGPLWGGRRVPLAI